jgi:chromosome segregation ATPase
MMHQQMPNPKALNLEGLEDEKNKVTIGFKCQAQLKLRLANEATATGLTLSEYVETLILTNGQNNQASEKLNLKEAEIKRLNEQVTDLTNSMKSGNEKQATKDLDIKRLNEQIKIYQTRLKEAEDSQAQMKAKITKSNGDVSTLQTRLNFYEQHPLMVSLLTQYKGSKHVFECAEGGTQNLEIKDVNDIFTIIVNKAKLVKK